MGVAEDVEVFFPVGVAVAGVVIFEEGVVWGAFAGGVVAVGGVEEDEHIVEATARGFRGRR